MSALAWREALESVRAERNFLPLNELLGLEADSAALAPGINETVEWDGAFLTPLFVAVLLQLDDHLPQFLARGADINVHCLFDGFLLGPLHAAALRCDCGALSALLDSACDVNASGAETNQLDMPAGKTALARCNALHVLVAQDIFHDQVYRLLFSRGAKLSVVCEVLTPPVGQTVAQGTQTSGLLLPRLLGNTQATEERINEVFYEELLHIIRVPGLANELNDLLEMASSLRRSQPKTTYSFVESLDFCFPSNQDGELTKLVLYAADVGNCEALRLLLYSGADPGGIVQRSLPFSLGTVMTLSAGIIHLAALRGDLPMIEQLVFFGIDPASPPCDAVVRQDVPKVRTGSPCEEQWKGLSLLHLAVLSGHVDKLAGILKHNCDINSMAERVLFLDGESSELISVLHLAALQDDVDCTSKLLDLGAVVNDRARAAALERVRVCEMFGGPPVVGLDEWLQALLTGEGALQGLINRRTDLSRVLEFPKLEAAGAASTFAEQLSSLRLAGPELTGNLAKSLEEVPSVLRVVRPVHLACLLQQPWAIEILASNGVPIGDSTPPCFDVPRGEVPLPGPEGHPLSRFALDLIFLCARTGSMQVLEMLVRDPRFALTVCYEIPLLPDITPPYYPRKHPAGDDISLTWAWERLAPLEFALLHRRVDVAVLLCRLGASLLHTVDHVSVRPPNHYSITDHCFRNLTPLHICALLDFRLAASALLHQACSDGLPVFDGEHPRPQRQALLSASECKQCWATVDTAGDPAKEPWLWRDLTPLHLAIITGSLDTAEVLVDASSPAALDQVCYNLEPEGDSERSFSPLLLAFERGYKDLHRRIARKFPSC